MPGPGSYIDPHNPQFSSVTKHFLKFQGDRSFAEEHGIKLGAFGSNKDRFPSNTEKKVDSAHPQMDYLDHDIKNKAGATHGRIGSAAADDRL